MFLAQRAGVCEVASHHSGSELHGCPTDVPATEVALGRWLCYTRKAYHLHFRLPHLNWALHPKKNPSTLKALSVSTPSSNRHNTHSANICPMRTAVEKNCEPVSLLWLIRSALDRNYRAVSSSNCPSWRHIVPTGKEGNPWNPPPPRALANSAWIGSCHKAKKVCRSVLPGAYTGLEF